VDSNEENEFEPLLGRDDLIRIAGLSGLLWLSVGAIILYFRDIPTFSVFQSSIGLFEELGIGLAFGLFFGLLANSMMRIKGFRHIADDLPVNKVVKQADLNIWDVVLISLIAGITEEWLFRGALQPVLGIIITSVLFVAIHGYFKFYNPYQVMFGFFVLCLSFGLGFVFEKAGLLGAMAAHTLYDVIVMRSLIYQKARVEQ
jgi:membrane protease YdiL (CAAX protease family)